ncbi:MAG: hypothetical protein KQI62_17675 [Deltaproteobacteria bacterium]|nr:hypothetical protein [Deltaproteobacteria bacterium]
MEETQLAEDEINARYYLIAFLDVLGQKGHLRAMKHLPNTDEEKQTFINNLKKTYSVVTSLREGFKNYFDGVRPRIAKSNLIPPHMQEKYLALQQHHASFFAFSDSIIVSVPLDLSDEFCASTIGVFHTLMASSSVNLAALTSGVPLRGGVTVGTAIEVFQDKLVGREIYGQGLENAHYLESSVADYPRIVVGKDLINFVAQVRNQTCLTTQGQLAKSIAELCWKMLIRDIDGNYMLDFLGSTVKEMDNETIGKNNLIAVREFIDIQYQPFLKKGDYKLTSRYYRLARYFNYRAELWGLDPISI